jgi:hypothetical protein
MREEKNQGVDEKRRHRGKWKIKKNKNFFDPNSGSKNSRIFLTIHI